MLFLLFALLVLPATFGCETMNAAGKSVQDGATKEANQAGVIQTLIASLGNKDTKETAMNKLVQIGSQALPALTGALNTGTKETKQGALETLGKMGPTAQPAAEEVKKHTTSNDVDIKQAALLAYQKITGK